jgi:hypothetical protein
VVSFSKEGEERDDTVGEEPIDEVSKGVDEGESL